MKKIWLIIIMLWIVCANICGCGKKDDTNVSISPDIYTTGLSASDRKVDEFLEQLGSYDTGYTDDVCYNVSTEQLAVYGFEVFKFEKSRISFLLFDGEIYELASGFGFEGITYLAVADLNQDGHGELYFTNMAGSGNPYLEAGYFDTAVKEITVFDTVFHNSSPLYMEGGYAYGEDGMVQYETINIYVGDFDIHSSVEMELNISNDPQCMGAIQYDGSRFWLNESQTNGYAEEKDVVILPEESFLSDFEVIGNEVHIYCVVSLENQGSDSKTIKLSGDFQNEVNTGLLTSNSLEAHFVKENADTITLAGNSDAKYVEIEFVGEYAGTSVMSSKALPGITVLSEE